MFSPYRSLADVNPGNALLWTRFATQFDVNGVRKCENEGRHPLAPRLLTLGDGTTANTIPGQLVSRHGLSFISTNYISTGLVDTFERTDRFTMFVAVSGTSSAATRGYNMCSWDTNVDDYRGICFGSDANYNQILLADALVAQRYAVKTHIPYAATGSSGSFTTKAATYSGNSLVSGLNLYFNGNLVTTATSAKNNLSGTIKNGKAILIGARYVSGVPFGMFIGNIHNAMIFPWELTAQQVQYLDRLCRVNINAA